MNKQSVVYNNGILLNIPLKWSTDACYNIYKLQKYYDQWKKPDTKGYMFYDFISMKYPEQQIHRQKVD